MMNSRLQLVLKVALVAAPLTSSLTASADAVQQFRCSTDSLDPAQGLARTQWARKCGLTTNSNGSGSSFDSTMAFDQTFNPAREYREVNLNRAFTGNTNDFNVNYYYATSRFTAAPLYTVSTETTGPTAGFWTWATTTQRPRPIYPTFENTPVVGSGTQLFPDPALLNEDPTKGPVLPWQTTSCTLFTKNPTTGAVTPWSGNFYAAAYCESSCYTPDQSLRFADGDVNILEAMKAKRDDVVALAPDATLDSIATHVDKVYSYTTEIRDAEQVIYKIKTASGGTLSVTNEHPVMVSDGRLVKAETLTTRDQLIKADGKLDPIVHVEKTTFFGKVYNIKPMSEDLVSNVLIAQGFLVGSARFQNDDVEYMNRTLLYRGIPDEVMPR
jgi:hypothetical protein